MIKLFGLAILPSSKLVQLVEKQALTATNEAILQLHAKYGDDLAAFSATLNDPNVKGTDKLFALAEEAIRVTLKDGLDIGKDLAVAVAQHAFLDTKAEVVSIANKVLTFFKALLK